MRILLCLALSSIVACSDDEQGPICQEGDTTAPSRVRDLSSAEGAQGQLLLTWTAPADHGRAGTALEYDLRATRERIGLESWHRARQIDGLPRPAPPGQPESLEIESRIDPGDWFFALRTSDGVGNISAMSNVLRLTIDPCFAPVPSTEVDFVFGNLDGSMQCGQSWTYLDQLAGDFVFVASPGVQDRFPDVFSGDAVWGIADEKAFVDRLFAEADAIESNLLSTEIDRSGTRVIESEAEYRVSVRTGAATTVYSGVARYTVRQEATTWLLTRWEDVASENPLGLLRGEFAR